MSLRVKRSNLIKKIYLSLRDCHAALAMTLKEKDYCTFQIIGDYPQIFNNIK